MNELKKGTLVKFKEKKSIIDYYKKHIGIDEITNYTFSIQYCISHGPGDIKTYKLIPVNGSLKQFNNRNYVFGTDSHFVVIKEELETKHGI